MVAPVAGVERVGGLAEGDVIRPAALFQCCVESIRAAPAGREGDRLVCRSVPEDGVAVVFRDGAWEWVGASQPLTRRLG